MTEWIEERLKRALYATRAEAQEVADKLHPALYVLRHSEHSRPSYKVRKLKGGYGIKAMYHFYDDRRGYQDNDHYLRHNEINVLLMIDRIERERGRK